MQKCMAAQRSMHNHEKVIDYHEIVIKMPYLEHNSRVGSGQVVMTLDVCNLHQSPRAEGFVIGSQKDR